MSQQEVTFVCHVLRKADTDTKKLAALLLIGKLFAQKELTKQDKSKLLKLIEGDFLLRLLNDFYERLSQPEQQTDHDDTSFSVDIVTHFIPSLIEHYEQSELVFEALGKILLANCSSNNPAKHDAQTSENIINCFECLNHSLASLEETKHSFIVQIYLDHLLKTFLLLGDHGEEDSSTIGVNKKIEALFVGLSQSLGSEHANKLLYNLAQNFRTFQNMDKFKLCRLIKVIVQSSQKDDTIWTLDQSTWYEPIRDTLFDIFKNKLSQPMRNDALDLTTQLTLKFDGFNWIKCQKWTEHNSKFFVLLLRLVCIETHLSLFGYYEKSECDCHKVGTCLVLLEHLIFGLINNLDDDEEQAHVVVPDDTRLQISSDMIASSIKAITEAMSKVVEFIKQVSLQEERPLSGDILHLTLAAVRLLCAYLNEESESLRDEVADVLPFILDLFKQKSNSSEQMQQISSLLTETLGEDLKMKEIFQQHSLPLIQESNSEEQ